MTDVSHFYGDGCVPPHEEPRVFHVSQHRVGAVYVGRPSKWGNPFRISGDVTRAEAIDRYRTWLNQRPSLLAALSELRGRDLCCHCAPLPCHGDVLLELANA